MRGRTPFVMPETYEQAVQLKVKLLNDMNILRDLLKNDGGYKMENRDQKDFLRWRRSTLQALQRKENQYRRVKAWLVGKHPTPTSLPQSETPRQKLISKAFGLLIRDCIENEVPFYSDPKALADFYLQKAKQSLDDC